MSGMLHYAIAREIMGLLERKAFSSAAKTGPRR